MRRVIAYIDGFNLYHAIDDLPDPKAKWINLWSLCESLCGEGEQLVAVRYCTALATWDLDDMHRHQRYIRKLTEHGVEPILGRFKKRRTRCKADCGKSYTTREEKESDVNLGVRLVADAIRDRFDRALIITADTDLKAAIHTAWEETEGKTLNVIAPPGRYGRHNELKPIMAISKTRLAEHEFDQPTREFIRNG